MPQLTLSRDAPLDAAASIALGPDALSSPRAVNKAIWRLEHKLSDSLSRALRDVVRGQTASDAWITLRECGVDALAGIYATVAVESLRTEVQHWKWLRLTRQLGGQTYEGVSSDLDDVRDGPVRILEAADIQPPTLVVDATNVFELKSNQRAALLGYLCRLTPGVQVRITGPRRVQRLLLERHRDDLPASVIDNAESTLNIGPTRTAKRREHVRDLLARRDSEHEDWRRLKVLADAPRERLTYDALLNHQLIGMSRDALKQWAKRMADYDLVDRTGPRTARAVVLRPAGAALLDEHPTLSAACDDHPERSGRTDAASQPGDTVAAAENAAVSDPPNNHDSTVYFPPAHDSPPDRPVNEGESAVTGGSGGGSQTHPSVEFLDGHVHDAAVAAADTGQIALCDRPIDERDDARTAHYSFLEERDELVVDVEASGTVALTQVRRCAALLNDVALSQALNRDKLAGGPDRHGIAGLPVENPYVLRDGACLGWLKNENATASGVRDRLVAARNDLLARTEDIAFDEDRDEEAIAQLARDAHGLAGTAMRLYDMLGIDVTTVYRFPDWALDDADRRRHVAKMLATETAISSRYGVYSANRVLYEPRSEKREQLLGTPDVGQQDPMGDVCGSWVLVGDGVDDLRNELKNLDDHLSLQEDEEHFAPFCLDLDIVDANRREAYAVALSRQARLKNIETTRRTVSFLYALTRDIFAATRGLSRLGSEDRCRDLSDRDLRYALSFCKAAELVPELGPHSVSQVAATLLDATGPLTTSILADEAGVSTQTIRNNSESFDKLEALGLLERDRGDAGEPTTWRFTLPFDEASNSATAPTIHDRMPFEDEHPTAAVAELFFTLGDDLGREPLDFGGEPFLQATTNLPDARDIGPLLRVHPEHQPLLTLLFNLLGEDLRDWVDKERERPPKTECSVQLGQDPDPEMTQSSFRVAAD